MADQISFPVAHLGSHLLFGSFKNTLISRDIVYQNQMLNDGLLQRYWMAGGILLKNTPRETSSFMAAAGLNSDFADLGPKDWNSEWIYTHAIQFTPRFRAGLGLDMQQFSGRFFRGQILDYFVFYPLIFIDWRLMQNTKVIWDADYLELRQFVGNKLALTAGLRFNLEFFALKNDASYAYQSTGAEAGAQYSLGQHFYLRLKYKELLIGREMMIAPHDQALHQTWIHSGRSIRLNLAYGM